MLIACSSCNSKYLINSADLKPEGKSVQCAKCGYNWFQEPSNDNAEVFNRSVPSTEEENKQANHVKNLPSPYVKEQKPSAFNSISLVFSISLLLGVAWQINNKGINFLVLIKFYIQEFYFNLKLVINDLATIIYQILN